MQTDDGFMRASTTGITNRPTANMSPRASQLASRAPVNADLDQEQQEQSIRRILLPHFC